MKYKSVDDMVRKLSGWKFRIRWLWKGLLKMKEKRIKL
jgi:hypothetical protein